CTTEVLYYYGSDRFPLMAFDYW
nr:immunoglobulin heavy chain junction region [Macaca mulatta]MOV86994.1 immunoglobulin heavy chain junction region [Macaca mulatta]